MDEDGFYYGELNGQRGLVPSNFLEEVSPEYAQPKSTHRSECHSNHQTQRTRHSDGHTRPANQTHPAKSMPSDHHTDKINKDIHAEQSSNKVTVTSILISLASRFDCGISGNVS